MPNKMKTQLTLKESLLQMDPRSKATKAKKRLPAIKLSTSKTILEKKVPVISLTAMLDPPVSPLVLDLPNYKWLQNSCWLDTSLQLLYVAMHHSHNEFSHIHDGLPKNSAIKVVLATLLEWYELEEKSRIAPAILRAQRDDLWHFLCTKKAINSVTGFESLFVSVLTMLIDSVPIYLHGYGVGSLN